MTAVDFAADRFYTPAEVAEGLGGFSEFTLRGWVKAQKVAHRRVGPQRRILFTREDVAALKESFAVPAAPAAEPVMDEEAEDFPFKTSRQARRAG